MKRQNKLHTLLRMLGLVKPLSGFMVFAVCMGTLGFLAAELIPILGSYAVLHGLHIPVSLSLKTIWTLLIVCALFRSIFRFAEQRTNHYIAFTLLAIIRDRVFQALRRLCPAKLEGRDKGDLISLITSDVELMEVFYAHTISPICISIISEGIMTVFIARYHIGLGLLALCAYLTIGVLVPMIISHRSGTLGEDLRKQSGALAAHMLESIRGIDETLQYNYGDARQKEIVNRTNELSERQGVLSALTGTNLAVANTLILFFDGLMLVIGAMLYQNGAIGFDGFLISLVALMSSFGPVSALAALGTTLENTVASGARILSIIDEEPVVEDITGQPELQFAGAECKDVSFSYGGEMVLNHVNVTFPENRIIGIVGKSGCGKSTLLKLLMRFWKTEKGTVSISGQDVGHINTNDLRTMESYMTQDTQLFKDTIAGNLRIAKLDATQEEIESACRKASIHEFIQALPNGYDTQVGELGSTLSGGEKQRIGLARAFLHDAKFMLLDEPTSSLDSLNEAIILKALSEASQERTVVLVSHRESTVRIADEILNMEAGRLS